MNYELLRIIPVLFIFGGGFLYKAYQRRKRLQNITGLPRSKIESAPQGLVELQGFAWPCQTPAVTAEGAEAIYYSFDLQKQESGRGDRKNDWVSVYKVVRQEVFYLVDPTGAVLVDPAEAQLDLANARTRTWRQLSDVERQRIISQIVQGSVPSFPPSNFLFGVFSGQFRVVESELRAGSPVFATGDFCAPIDGPQKIKSPGLSFFCARVFDSLRRETKNLTAELDQNHDGTVTFEESRAGYSAMARSARLRAQRESPPEKEFVLHGVLRKSAANALFVADTDQAHLKDRLSRFLWTQFVAGALLIALGLTLAVSRDLNSLLPNQLASKVHFQFHSKRKPATNFPAVDRDQTQ